VSSGSRLSESSKFTVKTQTRVFPAFKKKKKKKMLSRGGRGSTGTVWGFCVGSHGPENLMPKKQKRKGKDPQGGKTQRLQSTTDKDKPVPAWGCKFVLLSIKKREGNELMGKAGKVSSKPTPENNNKPHKT